MKTALVIWITALLVYGCAAVNTPLDDGYQYGDLTEWRGDYCETADPYRRAVLLALAARAGLVLPSDGICTNPIWREG